MKAKPKLLDNEKSVSFFDQPDCETWPVINIHYYETKRTWQRRYDGTLDLKVYHAQDGSESEPFDKLFSREWEVSRMIAQRDGVELSRTGLDLTDFDNAVLGYVLDVSKHMKLATKRFLSEDRFETLEERLVESVALAVERPQIAESYKKDKAEKARTRQSEEQYRISTEKANAIAEQERAQKAEETRLRKEQEAREEEVARVRRAEEACIRKEQEAREAEIRQRRDAISERVKSALIGFEHSAQYKLFVAAARQSDYNVPSERVRELVQHLFDSDDNLQHRPLLIKAKKGEWAEFVKSNLGEGFYNKLRNLEQDLDSFYLTVLEKVERKVGESGEVTEDLYYQMMCENFTLEDVTDLLDREREVYTDLLNRFKTILGKPHTHYTSALENMIGRLQFTGEFITATSPSVPRFKFSDSIPDDKASFQAAKMTVKATFQEYLLSNCAGIVVPVEGVDYCQSVVRIPVIRVSHEPETVHTLTGSYGIIQSGDYSETKKISFSFITGRPKELPFCCDVDRKTLRQAKSIKDKYGTINNAAQIIVEEAAERSLSAVKDKQLSAAQQKITEFHPYLDEQIEFRQQFYERMKGRFEKIYAEHSKKQESPSTPAPVAVSV